jgi:aspartate oxidase
MARAAFWREESRGCHYRHDFPQPVRDFAKQDVWTKGG